MGRTPAGSGSHVPYFTPQSAPVALHKVPGAQGKRSGPLHRAPGVPSEGVAVAGGEDGGLNVGGVGVLPSKYPIAAAATTRANRAAMIRGFRKKDGIRSETAYPPAACSSRVTRQASHVESGVGMRVSIDAVPVADT